MLLADAPELSARRPARGRQRERAGHRGCAACSSRRTSSRASSRPSLPREARRSSARTSRPARSTPPGRRSARRSAETPPTQAAALSAFREARPLLTDAAALARDIRPGVRLLPRAADELDRALDEGVPVLRRAVALAGRLEDTLAAVAELTRGPGDLGHARAAAPRARTRVKPTLETLAPAQIQCNYLGLWTRNIPNTISEGDCLGDMVPDAGRRRQGQRDALVGRARARPPREPVPARGRERRVRGGNEPWLPGPADRERARATRAARPRLRGRRTGWAANERTSQPQQPAADLELRGRAALHRPRVLRVLARVQGCAVERTSGSCARSSARPPSSGRARRCGSRASRWGRSKDVEPGEGDTSVVTLALEDDALPIHEDATLKVRPRIFLEGNFFVDLKPGSPGAPVGRRGPHASGCPDRGAGAARPDPVDLQADTRGEPQAAARRARRGVRRRRRPGAERGVGALGRGVHRGAIVAEAFRGTDEDDLPEFIDAGGDVAAAAARARRLPDLVEGLNRSARALASRRAELSASLPELDRLLEEAEPGARRFQRRVPAHARARAGRAARRARAAPETLELAIPVLEQARRLVAPERAAGAARPARPGGSLARAARTRPHRAARRRDAGDRVPAPQRGAHAHEGDRRSAELDRRAALSRAAVRGRRPGERVAELRRQRPRRPLPRRRRATPPSRPARSRRSASRSSGLTDEPILGLPSALDRRAAAVPPGRAVRLAGSARPERGDGARAAAAAGLVVRPGSDRRRHRPPAGAAAMRIFQQPPLAGRAPRDRRAGRSWRSRSPPTSSTTSACAGHGRT